MKKKLLAVLLAVMSVFLLVGCSSKDDLSGKYYWINEYRNELMVSISDNSGTIDVDGVTYSITNVDTDKKQITVNAGKDYVVPYSYKDGILTLTEDSLYGYSYESKYYKEDSEACKKALKKNGYKAVGTYK
ncbi:hypothetical protein [uncultured Streptococcus sp.]|uniref:hypothetical protein n=1 Tax=uncultured Streptococcus sp. TaxID=83427 RepID=UPI002594FD92|nr:hypothetical protein [uncultured Streptococcus sp.]